MVRILTAVLFCLVFAVSASADGRVFPPDDCTNTSPFMAFNGVTGGGNTYCINGQSILTNALPACGAGQVVAHNGASFYCKPSELEVPACAPGEFLTSDGDSFICTSASVPTCAGNQVLTYNGSAFICVMKTDSIPTCGANQFLTYNGTDFQCAATQTLSIPTCASGEVLTANGSNLSCVTSAAAQPSGTWCGLRRVAFGGGGNTTYYSPNIPCNGVSITATTYLDENFNSVVWPVNCPSGYSGAGFRGTYIGDWVTCVKQ